MHTRPDPAEANLGDVEVRGDVFEGTAVTDTGVFLFWTVQRSGLSAVLVFRDLSAQTADE
ncbi:hypothetical protein [Telluribacter humicola]|uniref:hypothetical protein n=1 Tax=Telluribacter humicola TaxID=1720261 RepID=UPI001A95D5B3|nr:hypothetical protein [Telluribacter humicola]